MPLGAYWCAPEMNDTRVRRRAVGDDDRAILELAHPVLRNGFTGQGVHSRRDAEKQWGTISARLDSMNQHRVPPCFRLKLAGRSPLSRIVADQGGDADASVQNRLVKDTVWPVIMRPVAIRLARKDSADVSIDQAGIAIASPVSPFDDQPYHEHDFQIPRYLLKPVENRWVGIAACLVVAQNIQSLWQDDQRILEILGGSGRLTHLTYQRPHRIAFVCIAEVEKADLFNRRRNRNRRLHLLNIVYRRGAHRGQGVQSTQHLARLEAL